MEPAGKAEAGNAGEQVRRDMARRMATLVNGEAMRLLARFDELRYEGILEWHGLTSAVVYVLTPKRAYLPFLRLGIMVSRGGRLPVTNWPTQE
jgi:hypothetical protein